MTTLKAPKTAKSRSSRILDKSDHHLTLSDGKSINAGTLDDWLEGMKMRQNVQKIVDDWVQTNSQLVADCRSWALVNMAWVREVAIRFNTEPRSLAIFVVLKDRNSLDLSKRRTVADLGLIVGGIYNVRSEARIVGERPEGCIFVGV